jgi:hypothetical protein
VLVAFSAPEHDPPIVLVAFSAPEHDPPIVLVRIFGTRAPPIAQGCSSSTRSCERLCGQVGKRAKRRAAIEGTRRAPGAGMHDANAIEAINFEQLATATDRLLLCGQASKRRPTRPSLARDARARRRFDSAAFAHQPQAPQLERTTIIRPERSHVSTFAMTIVIPTLAGITAGLAALL